MNLKKFDCIRFLLLVGTVVFINIIFSEHFFRLDLTQDKRYTISPSTKEKLKELKEQVFVDVFLDGDLNPDYTRLRRAIKETLEEFKAYSGDKIVYRFTDPNAIEDKRLREQFYNQLIQKGVQYKYDLVQQGGAREEKIVFPSALISMGDKETPVMFLKGSKILPMAQQLNQSVEGVEYELMAAIRKLSSEVSKTVAFTEGHGELSAAETGDISTALSEYYNVERIPFSDTTALNNYQALIIAGPTKPFSEKEKFILDQYIIKGGRVLFFIDQLNLNKDSLVSGVTYGFSYNLGLDDLLFKYGVRINDDLIQDLNCALLKVEVPGGQAEMVSWPYFPIFYSFGKHPVVKNLDAVIGRYVSSIDTVKAVGITKTPLIFTSKNTRLIKAPLPVDLNEARKNLDPKDFNLGMLPVAYLLEGRFESVYKNRPSPINGVPVVKQDTLSKLLVVSDVDLIRNETDKGRNQPIPLGYDPDLKYLFSNKEFIMNALDYLMDEPIVEAKGKEIQLRPLDKNKLAEEKTYWQIINLVVPVVLLVLFGISRYYLRKRKYTSFR
jgi:ABC-2 type transport system permease protein